MAPIHSRHGTFYSENHERDIHLGRFASFVSSVIPHPDSNENPGLFHIERNMPILEMIANGLSIWDRGNPTTQPIRRDILWCYGAFFTNNQGAERANKDQNLANFNFRSEGNTSKRMIAMAFIKEMCDGSIIGEKRAAFRGPQHIMAMMDRITKIHDSLQTLRQELGEGVYQEKKQRMAEKLQRTFEVIQVQQAKGDFEEALKVTHIPSAKENVEGFDTSPLLENKLQLGKLNDKGTNNLQLLGKELIGRMQSSLGRSLTDDELKEIEKMGINTIKEKIMKKLEAERCKDDPKFNRLFF
jgi:hypothetical protein